MNNFFWRTIVIWVSFQHDIKGYYEMTIIKTVWFWHRNKPVCGKEMESSNGSSTFGVRAVVNVVFKNCKDPSLLAPWLSIDL